MGGNIQDVMHLIICLVIMPTGVVEAACQNCEVCYGSTCMACSAGYFIDSNWCRTCTGVNWNQCTACEDGYYRSGSTCKPCSPSCVKCNIYARCYECKSGTFLYINRDNYICHKCPAGCSQCYANKFDYQDKVCTDCSSGYFHLDGVTCSLCVSTCTKCSSSTQCTECPTGRYGTSCHSTCTHCKQNVCYMSGVCAQGCDSGYYGNYCKNRCRDPCLTCTSSTACQSCPEGKYLAGETCKPCVSPCIKCSSRYECTECIAGHYGRSCLSTCTTCKQNVCDMSGVCEQGCDSGYYGDYCKNRCRDPCLTCTSSTACQSCPEGKYLAGETCKPCVSPCIKCSSRYECTECIAGHYGRSCLSTCTTCKQNVCDMSGVCEQGCDSGYYGDDCKTSCNDRCLTCTSWTVCQSCTEGNYLAGETCSPCVSPCIKCSSRFQCTECIAGHYGTSCQSTCTTCKQNICDMSGVCEQGCDSGYYGDDCSNRCRDPCLTCTSSTECHSCTEGTYLAGGTCSRCVFPCTKCSSRTQCTECVTGRYTTSCQSTCTTCKQNVCARSGFCTHGCADGYYGTYCSNTCSDSCLTCTSSSQCQTCAEGTYRMRMHVYNIYGYYCPACPDKCATCTSMSSCQSCSSNHYSANTYVNCECDTTKCMSNTVHGACTACTDKTWYPTVSGCCPCSQRCKDQRCRSDRSCSDGCVKGYYGDICQYTCQSNDAQCTECSGNNKSAFVCKECRTLYFPSGSRCQFCNYKCKYNGGYATCDSRNGTCIKGCKDGWFGDKCDSPCPIDNCEVCADTNGEITCDTCDNNYYKESDKNCSSCSSHCYQNTVCNKVDGSCTEGCDNGWHGDRCDRECSPGCSVCNQDHGACMECNRGKHGVVCDHECSIGCRSVNGLVTCAQDGGTCTNGCVTGHWNNICENLCNDGCLNSTCDRSTGHCFDGCLREYFGNSCESPCSYNCLDVEVAKDTNLCWRDGGACIGGCIAGYYGDTCGEECGNCQNTTCHLNNGTCVYGCVAGYIGSMCKQAASSGEESGTDGATIGGAVGGSLAAVIIVIVVVILIMRKRRRGGLEKGSNSTLLGRKSVKKEAGPIYQNAAADFVEITESDAVVYVAPRVAMPPGKQSSTPNPLVEYEQQMQHRVRQAPPLKPKPNRSSNKQSLHPEEEQQQQQRPEPDVIGNANRKSSAENLGASIDAVLEPLDEGEELVSEFVEGDTYYNTAAILKSRIPVDVLAEFVAKKSKSYFETEFKKLPPGLTRPYKESQKPHNIPKNRYRSIYPYDDTRVVLKDGGADYINASYIQGHTNTKAYIAALGPTTASIDDFWRMVWQEDSQVIVMLTRLVEATHPKCQQYWPDRGRAGNYGDIHVACHTEDPYAEYTVRSFSATKGQETRKLHHVHFTAWPDKGVPDDVTGLIEFRQKGQETRKLHHVHFTAWPDKGVPDDVTGLIEFRQKVNNLQTRLDVPMIVHCSAGIGRTGTFIALDTLTKSGEDEGTVDVFGCVVAMRGQRVNLVQTEEQYTYLHHAVVHSLTFGCRSIPAEELPRHYAELLSGQSGTASQLDKRFEQLQSVGEAMSKDSESSVQTNRSFTGKNREGSDIPGDRYRPKLFLNRKPGAPNYINAVRLNSFVTKDRFIAAQTPLPTTVVDFITLVLQENCPCIVSMDTDDSQKTLGKYFTENGTMKHGVFTVKCQEVTTTEYSILRKLLISTHAKTGTEDHVVWQTQYTDWSSTDVVPREPEALLRMIQDVDKLYTKSGSSGPVIVHCMTGAERSGLYCAVAALVEKMEIDHEVSLVNTLRQIKSRRRAAIPNKEQYRFCHQAIVAYLESFSTYSNFSLRI